MNTHVVENPNSGVSDGEITVTAMEAVTALLIEAGHPHPSYWLAGLHPDAFATTDHRLQRFLINRYWRMELAKLEENTMDVRFCLIDEAHVSTKDWLRVFKQGVLPCILKHSLPRIGI